MLAGGLFAVVVHLTPALVDRRGPERRVVGSAAEAVADYVEAIGSARADAARTEAAERLYEAWRMVVDQQPMLRHPGRELLRLRELSRQLQLVLADAMRRDRPDPTAAARARRLSRQALQRPGEGLDYVAVALPMGRPTRLTTVRSQLRPGSRSLLVLTRVAIAAAVAGGLGTALGLTHAYWAIAAAVLVLSPGFDRLRTIQRGLQRTVGTVIGVGLAAVLLALHPADGVLIGLVAGLVFLTQLLVPRNYAGAAVFITASALLIAGAGLATGSEQELLVARAGETALGCAIALVVFALEANRSPAGWLPTVIAKTLEAAADAVDQLTPATVTSPAGMTARRTLQDQAVALLDTFETGLNGFPQQRTTAERLWPAVVACERLAYRVLAEGWRMQEAGPAQRPVADPPPSSALRQLAEAVRQRRGVRRLQPLPSFVSRDVGDLERVLRPLDLSRLPDQETLGRL